MPVVESQENQQNFIHLSGSRYPIELSKYSGLSKCAKIYNGVSANYKNLPIMFLTCQDKQAPPGRWTEKTIEIIYNNTLTTYKIEETNEFMDWSADNLPWKNYLGAEDPRIMEFKDELYMSYSMNNVKAQRPVRGQGFLKISDVFDGKRDGRFLQYGNSEMEKNWLFINNGTNLLVVYQLYPYILGEVIGNDFVPRIQRTYKCFEKFMLSDKIHLATNAIKINNQGVIEYMFLYNYIRSGDLKDRYVTHIGFMESQAPFEILRISALSVHVELNWKSFQYISSVSVKGKSNLSACDDDVLLFGGGLDDIEVFQGQISLKDVLRFDTVECVAELSEWKYFPSFRQMRNDNGTGIPVCNSYLSSTIPLLLVTGFALVAIFLVYFNKSIIKYRSAAYNKLI